MRMNEDRIRGIIREEARRALREGTGDMSILPADVPVDLFVGFFRRRAGAQHPSWVSAFTPSNRERLIKNGINSGLSQGEAEELTELGIMCLGPGKDFPFAVAQAPAAVVESLGYDPRRARNLIDSMRRDLYEHMGKSVSSLIFYYLHHGHAAGELNRQHNRPRGLRPEIEALQAIDRTELERGVELMDSLYDFTERVKGAPKSTRQKLMRMIGPDGSGLMQAVEIASTIL
jgi:hypothetical protein